MMEGNKSIAKVMKQVRHLSIVHTSPTVPHTDSTNSEEVMYKVSLK